MPYCRDELKSLRDLKGRKVRTSGASQSDFIEHFGGSGVPIAFGEVQQVLEKCVIECSITGTLGGFRELARSGEIPAPVTDQPR